MLQCNLKQGVLSNGTVQLMIITVCVIGYSGLMISLFLCLIPPPLPRNY